MVPTAEEESEYAKKMLARADRVLADIDQAYIIQERGHSARQMPKFRPEEISLGKMLGKGGFGIVNEIEKFTLDPDDETDATNGEGNQNQTSTQPAGNDDNAKHVECNVQHSDTEYHGDHVHYDVTKARHYMEKRVKREGVARYALKRLHGNLTELERARGMIDLAVEAKYLSVVWHPNIIKLRGIAAGNMVDKDFFIILDRLYETLDKRTISWEKRLKSFKGRFGLGKDAAAIKQLLVERMIVAYDLAAAFFYLHENRLVYRDIKPENIGFDIRGDVKVFDFGLCKSLSSKLKAREGYGYRLTGQAGSLPYMAPEVVRSETYDTKCDVFSFAILLWEILSLQGAFKGYSPTKFVNKVVVEHERLPVPKTWPPLTRIIIPEAWDKDPRKRPDMKRVAIIIRGDLNDLTTDEEIRRRTRHMKDRSLHSLDGNGE